ncbi:MAG: DNA-binding protein [Mesorhizobium amorphae]|nr:MAG: DNA-binding protein [Mesorhizobium amorphae]
MQRVSIERKVRTLKQEKITRGELVARIAEASGEPKSRIDAILNALASVVTDAAALGKVVPVPGLGAFSSRPTKERNVRNPRSGETFVRPAGRAGHFRMSAGLKRDLSA